MWIKQKWGHVCCNVHTHTPMAPDTCVQHSQGWQLWFVHAVGCVCAFGFSSIQAKFKPAFITKCTWFTLKQSCCSPQILKQNNNKKHYSEKKKKKKKFRVSVPHKITKTQANHLLSCSEFITFKLVSYIQNALTWKAYAEQKKPTCPRIYWLAGGWWISLCSCIYKTEAFSLYLPFLNTEFSPKGRNVVLLLRSSTAFLQGSRFTGKSITVCLIYLHSFTSHLQLVIGRFNIGLAEPLIWPRTAVPMNSFN